MFQLTIVEWNSKLTVIERSSLSCSPFIFQLVNTWQEISDVLFNAGIGIWSQLNNSFPSEFGIINVSEPNFNLGFGIPALNTIRSFENAPIFGTIIAGKVAIYDKFMTSVLSFNVLKSTDSQNKHNSFFHGDGYFGKREKL